MTKTHRRRRDRARTPAAKALAAPRAALPSPSGAADDEVHDELDDAQAGEIDQSEADAARRRREKWERYRVRADRERDETRRYFFTMFGMWLICPHPACRRARACVTTDTEECRRDRWRHAIPDEIRIELSKICNLVAQHGHSVADACRLAREDMEMHAAKRKEIEARTGYKFSPDEPEADPNAPTFEDLKRMHRP